jgi:hypothetical protein
MKQNIGLITSDEQTKTAVHAAGVEQGRREATARWARFAPDVPHSAVGPLKITNAAGLVVPSNEFSEARHGLAFQGGAPMRVQPTTAAGVPLPSLAQAVYPGRGPEAQVRPSPAPDWDAPVHLGTPEAPPSGAEMHPSLAAAADPRVAAVTSDERMKTNTSQDGRGNALDETFRGMPAYQFAYKDGTPGEIPGIPRAGIMAQDAERTPFGAALVQDGPDGIKRIDSNAATSLTLAASSDHNARIRKLEEILGRGGR